MVEKRYRISRQDSVVLASPTRTHKHYFLKVWTESPFFCGPWFLHSLETSGLGCECFPGLEVWEHRSTHKCLHFRLYSLFNSLNVVLLSSFCSFLPPSLASNFHHFFVTYQFLFSSFLSPSFCPYFYVSSILSFLCPTFLFLWSSFLSFLVSCPDPIHPFVCFLWLSFISCLVFSSSLFTSYLTCFLASYLPSSDVFFNTVFD